jgi:hypothetical protein
VNAAKRFMGFAVLCIGVLAVGCSSTPKKPDAFGQFLQTIAASCQPLIIGTDNMGQAITFNGLGATLEDYNNFLGKTEALFNGGITPQIYRESLGAFLGAGRYNTASFNCIISYLPKSTGQPATK